MEIKCIGSNMVRLLDCIVLFVVADTALALINNTQIEARNNLENKEGRRSRDKHQSTSSSEDRVSDSKESDNESMGMSDSSSISESDKKDKKKKKNKDHPVSSLERKGWRKWHRKCPRCETEMNQKWKDSSIKWICGGYQRARRSFKSLCMMHYRNCQDGTMFVKIHDHRCANSSAIKPHGDHFFYDYRVQMSVDSSDSKSVSDSVDGSSSYS